MYFGTDVHQVNTGRERKSASRTQAEQSGTPHPQNYGRYVFQARHNAEDLPLVALRMRSEPCVAAAATALPPCGSGSQSVVGDVAFCPRYVLAFEVLRTKCTRDPQEKKPCPQNPEELCRPPAPCRACQAMSQPRWGMLGSFYSAWTPG